jgi:hypothetical protein
MGPAASTDEGRTGRKAERSRSTNAAAALADRLTASYANVVAYGAHQTSQITDPRLGCRVLTTAAYGLDLAAHCLNA